MADTFGRLSGLSLTGDGRSAGFLEHIQFQQMSRHSSFRILGAMASCQTVNSPGLHPAGEGAGNPGRIILTAVDGMRVAEAMLKE